MNAPAQPAELGSALSEWCERWLGAAPARTLLRDGRLSTVLGLELADGRRVVVKARAPVARLEGCRCVQGRLAEAGFPAPRPLAGPAPLGALAASAEALLPGGRQLGARPGAPGKFARTLARLVALAPEAAHVPSLDPPPAWLRFDHAEAGPWPSPETTPVDLNAAGGPPWLDELATRVRSVLAATALPRVVGHGDFESQNVRWRAGRLHVVHDWDSVFAAPEAVIAGAAAATFPARGPHPDTAGFGESAEFLRAYAAGRGRAWSDEEGALGWSAGLWVMAYNAKIALVEGDPEPVRRLRREADRRLELARA